MRERLLVLALLIVTALFAWGLGWIAWGFARAGGAIGLGLALAVVLLLLLTVWVTWREVRFGLSAARLARLAGADADRDADDGAQDPRARFEEARQRAEAAPEDWRAWYRVALAYEALRDRAHARESVRRAILLEREGR